MTIPFPVHPVLGFAIAGLSASGLWLAETLPSIPPDAKSWLEIGGSPGFIAGLCYGCVALWKEVQTQRREMAELNKEIRTDWKAQNEELISALNNLNPKPVLRKNSATPE